MPVNSHHSEYDANAFAWQRARDVFAGEDAIKAAGEKYLPRLDCQDDAEYLAYKNRALLFNAVARTGDGFVGLIFRRDPTFKLPADNSGVAAALSKQHGATPRGIVYDMKYSNPKADGLREMLQSIHDDGTAAPPAAAPAPAETAPAGAATTSPQPVTSAPLAPPSK